MCATPCVNSKNMANLEHKSSCLPITISIKLMRRPEDLHRIRVEHMERQLANLTGLVQKALTQNVPAGPQPQPMNSNYLTVSGQYRGECVYSCVFGVRQVFYSFSVTVCIPFVVLRCR